MKKLLMLLVLLSAPTWVGIDSTHTLRTPIQSQPVDYGQGIFWIDSLWNGVYVMPNDTSFTATDTTVILDTLSANVDVEITLNFEYDFLTLTVIDTGTTYTDSCIAEFAAYEFNKVVTGNRPKYTIKETYWNSINFLKDSTWTSGNLVPNNDLRQTYTAFVGNLAKIRLRMTNLEAVNNRVWKFIIQASRKK